LGDEAFYYYYKDGKLVGQVLTHVDDFFASGTKEFLAWIRSVLQKELQVSKIESNSFRFTGIDIQKVPEGIRVSMEEYAKSLEDIENIREAPNDELLTKLELKVYRKMTGKISWLAQNTRPDLSFVALDLSKQNSCAKIKDLKRINVVLERVRSKPSVVMFTKIGEVEDLVVFGLTDGSYKLGEKAVGGSLVILGNKNSLGGVPLYWRSKTLKKVCTSAKAVETHAMTRHLNDIQFFTLQLQQILAPEATVRIPIRIFTDSKPLLESIGSIHQVENKLLRNNVQDMKDMLYEGIVLSFSWLEAEEMLADLFTKDRKNADDLDSLTQKNVFLQAQQKKNMVVCLKDEIKFLYRCDKVRTLKKGKDFKKLSPLEVKQ
jgi:hypothetical protein